MSFFKHFENFLSNKSMCRHVKGTRFVIVFSVLLAWMEAGRPHLYLCVLFNCDGYHIQDIFGHFKCADGR